MARLKLQKWVWQHKVQIFCKETTQTTKLQHKTVSSEIYVTVLLFSSLFFFFFFGAVTSLIHVLAIVAIIKHSTKLKRILSEDRLLWRLTCRQWGDWRLWDQTPTPATTCVCDPSSGTCGGATTQKTSFLWHTSVRTEKRNILFWGGGVGGSHIIVGHLFSN